MIGTNDAEAFAIPHKGQITVLSLSEQHAAMSSNDPRIPENSSLKPCSRLKSYAKSLPVVVVEESFSVGHAELGS